MKTNIVKALRKAKKELKGYSHEWYAVIDIYENGAVYMYLNAAGFFSEGTVHKFGDRKDSKLICQEGIEQRNYNSVDLADLLACRIGEMVEEF